MEPFKIFLEPGEYIEIDEQKYLFLAHGDYVDRIIYKFFINPWPFRKYQPDPENFVFLGLAYLLSFLISVITIILFPVFFIFFKVSQVTDKYELSARTREERIFSLKYKGKHRIKQPSLINPLKHIVEIDFGIVKEKWINEMSRLFAVRRGVFLWGAFIVYFIFILGFEHFVFKPYFPDPFPILGILVEKDIVGAPIGTSSNKVFLSNIDQLIAYFSFHQYLLLITFFPITKIFSNFLVYLYDLLLTPKSLLSFMVLRTTMCILVETRYSKNLSDLQFRESIIKRVRAIENLNSLMGQKISRDLTRRDQRDWVKAHFNKINMSLQEKARWIATPTAQTGEDIEKYFRSLFDFYLKGLHGEFDWHSVDESSSTETDKEKSWEKPLKVVLSFVPLVLFTFLLIQKSFLENLGIPSAVIGYISIAWFFIIIDKLLDFGIVDTLVDIAKGFRDLNK